MIKLNEQRNSFSVAKNRHGTYYMKACMKTEDGVFHTKEETEDLEKLKEFIKYSLDNNYMDKEQCIFCMYYLLMEFCRGLKDRGFWIEKFYDDIIELESFIINL